MSGAEGSLDELPNEHTPYRQLPMAPVDTPSNVPRGTQQNPPTVDEFLGPVPTVDQFLGRGPGPSFGERVAAATDYNTIRAAARGFGQGFAQGFGSEPLGFSPETEKALREHGLWSGVSKGQEDFLRTLAEAVIIPTARDADAVWRSIAGLGAGTLGAVKQGLAEYLPAAFPKTVERYAGSPEQLSQDVTAEAERRMNVGALEAAPLPRRFPEPEPIPPKLLPAPESEPFHPSQTAPYRIGGDEGAYFGTSPPKPTGTPEAVAADVHHAEEQAKESPTGAAPQPPEAQAPAPDIHQVARTIAPQTFDEYDALATRREELRSNLAAATQELHQNAAAQAPHAAEIQDLEQRLAVGTTPRLAKKYEERLANMRPDHDAFLESDQYAMLTRDTDEMSQMRRELQQADYRMRDLAPQVSAAYREAGKQFPEEAAPPPATEAAVQQEEKTAPVAPEEQPTQAPVKERLAQASEAEAQLSRESEAQAGWRPVGKDEILQPGAHVRMNMGTGTQEVFEPSATPRVVPNIADDVSQKLVSAGRPQEEADAAAAIIQARYETRAADFGGAKGSAEEMYSRDAPEIRGAVSGGPKGAASGKTKIEDGRKIITLFQKADASTFIHETGHDWLEQMMTDAEDPLATADMKARAQTVRDWLKSKEGAELTRAQHERFAKGFTRYMMEGTAPTRALDGVFAKFKDWLSKLYQTVQNLTVPIKDDIRDVFDRLLSRAPEPSTLASEMPETVAEARPAGVPRIQTIQEIMADQKVTAKQARRLQDQQIAAWSERAPAPEEKVTGDIADIHQADVSETPPEQAASAADQVEQERKEAAQAHAPEVEGGPNTGAATEAGGSAGGLGSVPGASGGTRPDYFRERPFESEAYGGRGGAAAAEGNRSSEEPSHSQQAYDGPTPRYLDKAGNIRLELLTNDMEARAALREMADRNNQFMRERRGVVTDQQVIDLANDINANTSQINMDKLRQMSVEDDVPMAARILAGRKMLLQVDAEVREAAANNDVQAFIQASDRYRMIQATVSGITAEWGRAGRAFRDMAKEEQAARGLASIVREATGKELFQIQKQMLLVRNTPTPGQTAKFLRDSTKKGLADYLESIWTNGLIAGIQTHTKYLLGNEALGLYRATWEAGWSAMLGTLRRAFGADATNAARFGEIQHQLFGWFDGNLRGLKAFPTALRTNEPIIPQEVSALGEVAGAPISMHGNVPNPKLGGITIPIGTVFEAPGRMVNAFHTVNWTTGYAQTMGALAYRKAISEGLENTPHFNDRIAYLYANPTEEMVRQASMGGADYAMMTRPQYGSLMQRISDVLNYGIPLPNTPLGSLGTLRPLKYIAPFVNVAATIQKAGIMRATPLALLRPAIWEELRAGGARFDRAAGAILAGTSFMVGGGSLAAYGLLNHGGPDNSRDWAAWRSVFGLPYGVRIGESSWDVRGFGALGQMASVAADLWHASEFMGRGDMEAVVRQIGWAFFNVFKEEGIVRSFSDIFKATDDSNAGSRWLRNFVASWVPFSVGMGQIARDIDPDVRQTRTMMDAIRAKIPFESETLRPRYNVWGQPVPNEGWMGTNYQHLANDPTEKLLERLGQYPALPKRDILGVHLTDQQYDDYTMTSGRIMKKRLDDVVNRPGFAVAPRGVQNNVIHEIINGARAQARGLIIHRSAGTDNDIARIARDNKRALFRKPVASSDEEE